MTDLVPMFDTRIIHKRITWSPFMSEEMSVIANATLDHMKQRIGEARDAKDNPANALNQKYAIQKTKGRFIPFTSTGGGRRYKGKPIRDWTLRGLTLQSVKVKRASEDMATIGPITKEAFLIIKARNKWDHMWGLSPSDMEACYGAVRQVLMSHVPLRIEG